MSWNNYILIFGVSIIVCSLLAYVCWQISKPFKKHTTAPQSGPFSFTLHEHPVYEHPAYDEEDAEFNYLQKDEKIKMDLVNLKSDFDQAKLKLARLETWYNEFVNLEHWMLMQGLWGAEDVDTDNPMQTYKNGLTRYINEHKEIERQ